MKTTNQNAAGSNHSTQTSHTSELSRSRLGLYFGLNVAAAFLSALTVIALPAYSAAQARTTLTEAMAQHPDWVQIPGELIRRDCVHAIPHGATVEVGGDGQITGDVSLNGELIAHYDSCSEEAVVTRPRAKTENLGKDPGTGNGWVEADQWVAPLTATDDIDYLSGTWTVPSYPSESGATVYLFNGIEPASGAWILQPVLQYGPNVAGGGDYWAIASWLVSSTEAFYSPLEIVNPGNTIFGYTEMTAISGSTKYFTVEARDKTTGAYSFLNAHVTGQHWTYAYAGVLEAYNVNSCAQFPASGRAQFKGTVVDHGFPYYDTISYPDWYGVGYGYGGPTCHFAVVAASATLDF